MKILSILLISLFTLNIKANDTILTQGTINVTFDDLDGFAYKIPDEKRSGFFSSPDRIEKTLFSILNMKHINAYGYEKEYIDPEKFKEKVNIRIIDLFPVNDEFDINKENKIILVRNFLKKEESYIQVQTKVYESIESDDLVELAEEKYIMNKDHYRVAETRNLDFISIIYNESNKKEKFYKAKELFENIALNTDKFISLQGELKNKDADIEITSFEQFEYDAANKRFSDAVFSENNIGIFNDLIDYNNRYIITNIKKIDKSRQLPFNDVKHSIIEELSTLTSEKKFNNILISLTKNKLIVNEQNLATLRDRYKN